MPAPQALRAVLLLLALAPLPAAAAAQTACTDAPPGVTVAGAAAAVHYDFAGGSQGAELGGEVTWRARRLETVASVFGIFMEGAAVRPVGVRGGVSSPLVEVAGVRLCGDATAGVTGFSGDGDAGTTVAGGLGATVATTLPLGAAYLTPFVGVRGVGAAVSGEVLGTDLAATGAGLGGTGGLAFRRGRLGVRASASLDGLAGGLGATAFPARAFRLVAGWRF